MYIRFVPLAVFVDFFLFNLTETINEISSSLLPLITMLIITGIARHTVRYLSDQSRRYAANLRTTLHCSNNSLGIMVCIHHGEHVPTIINLLEDSNSAKLSAILIFVLHLTDLTRHAVASLVPHPHLKIK